MNIAAKPGLLNRRLDFVRRRNADRMALLSFAPVASSTMIVCRPLRSVLSKIGTGPTLHVLVGFSGPDSSSNPLVGRADVSFATRSYPATGS